MASPSWEFLTADDPDNTDGKDQGWAKGEFLHFVIRVFPTAIVKNRAC